MTKARLRTSSLFLCLGLVAATGLNAQVTVIGGAVRERTEVDNRFLAPGSHADVYHLLRTRLNATATIADWLIATVEVQDSRTFGQERATLNSAAQSFDLRQGNVELKDIAGTGINAKIGRQVVNYANERLIGRSDWNNFGQSFDGLFTSYKTGDLNLDAFALAVARNPNTASQPDYHRDVVLSGLWGTWKPKDGTTNLQAFFLFDDPGTDSTRDNRNTAGIYATGTAGSLDYEVDGAYQFGNRRRGATDHPIGAYFAGIRVGYTFEDLKNFRIGIGFDQLSGLKENAPDTAYGAFNTLYGTNHKFYGIIDLFDNTAQRQDLGLTDPFVSLSIVPFTNTRFSADVHLLSTASDPTKVLTGAPANSTKAIGKELDLHCQYTPIKPLTVTVGYAIFDGDPDRYLVRGGRKTIQWGFAMVSVVW